MQDDQIVTHGHFRKQTQTDATKAHLLKWLTYLASYCWTYSKDRFPRVLAATTGPIVTG